MTPTRRTFLGSLASLPFAARTLLAPRQARGRVRPMILVWLDGGMSHLDVFDGKPEAPAEIRGDARWIAGAIPGTAISDHLPELARRLDRCALLRSLTHGEGNHDRASHFVLTGNRPSAVLRYPAMGAVLAGAHDAANPQPDCLPSYVAIPSVPEYGGAGFLPPTAGPFVLGAGGNAAGILHTDAAAETVDRLAAKIDALDGAPRSASEAAHDHFVRQAQRMSSDPDVRAAFDVAREPAVRRERFGNHALGKACLLALRLCRAGVQTVLVRDTGWDHHQGVRRALTYGFPGKLPALDQALAALLDELCFQAGGAVTVAVASEFGRTPRLNGDGGRDHWPRALSALLFGAGIRRGVVHGTTDARGEEPATDPCSPGDLWATLLAARGADLDGALVTDTGRPVRLVPDGAKPIAAVLAE